MSREEFKQWWRYALISEHMSPQDTAWMGWQAREAKLKKQLLEAQAQVEVMQGAIASFVKAQNASYLCKEMLSANPISSEPKLIMAKLDKAYHGETT